MHTFSPLPNAPVPRFPLKDSIRGAKPHTLRSIGQWARVRTKKRKGEKRKGETGSYAPWVSAYYLSPVMCSN